MTESNYAESRLHFRTFGALEIDGGDGCEALLAQPKRVALLTYICAARPAGFQRRDRLVGMFWPEHRQEHARSALRKAIWSIRQALGEDAVLGRGDEEIAINREVVWCDAYAFDCARTGDQLALALELYRGPFLESFYADAPEFGRWVEAQRATYREEAVDSAWQLADRYERGSDVTSAARWARRAARLSEGADERVIRRALSLLHRAGDRAGAMQVYDGFARELRAAFDVEPSAETQALMRSIRGG